MAARGGGRRTPLLLRSGLTRHSVRAFSVDHVPKLWHVLRGEMALVERIRAGREYLLRPPMVCAVRLLLVTVPAVFCHGGKRPHLVRMT